MITVEFTEAEAQAVADAAWAYIDDAIRHAALDHLRRLHAEDGPQALTAGEDAVPHGGVNRRRILRGRRQQAPQCGVGQGAAFVQRVLEHEEGSITGQAVRRQQSAVSK